MTGASVWAKAIGKQQIITAKRTVEVRNDFIGKQ
jgi:hypothetical protein